VRVDVSSGDEVGQPARRVVGRDIELEGRTLQVIGHSGQCVAGRGYVDAHDVCALAGEDARDRLADAAGGPGDDGDLAVHRLVPVGRRVDVGRPDPDDLTGDVR